jgi:hypothetical protein
VAPIVEDHAHGLVEIAQSREDLAGVGLRDGIVAVVQTTPPPTWLTAVRRVSTRPQSATLTTWGMRTRPVLAST